MKPRRDITLGEMQDECRKRMHTCAPDVDGNNECRYFDTCKQMLARCCIPPENWNLTDPPRFTEAQTALLKALWDIGAREIYKFNESGCVLINESGKTIDLNFTNLNKGETLELAEMFGKEGA